MQNFPCSLLLFLSISPLSVPALAQNQTSRDTERLGLAGPVKSVSATATTTDVRWQQPGGPTTILPIWCRECEFDRDGNQTKSGQIFNGNFQGEVIRFIKDANGHVTERLFEDATTGATNRREIIGPYGKTGEFFYRQGELQSFSNFRYDQYGHMVDWQTFDPDGTQTARTLINTDREGNNVEQWDWGKNGELLLHVSHTVDPKTKIENFTSFNEFGSVKLTWTMINGRLGSYWQLPSPTGQYGDGFTEGLETDTPETYNCHSDNTCEFSRVHFDYPDKTRRNPRSVEWRDAFGNLKLAAYYSYQFDAFGNWTHREIWVWSPELGQRQLYETDRRSLTYWTN
jgi:hypothetical protein